MSSYDHHANYRAGGTYHAQNPQTPIQELSMKTESEAPCGRTNSGVKEEAPPGNAGGGGVYKKELAADLSTGSVGFTNGLAMAEFNKQHGFAYDGATSAAFSGITPDPSYFAAYQANFDPYSYMNYASHMQYNYHPAALWQGRNNYPGRKTRQTYSRRQTTTLEVEFQANRYITRARRLEMTRLTGLQDKQVKIWFQNRRMKQKKELKDGKPAGDSSNNTCPSGAATTTSTQGNPVGSTQKQSEPPERGGIKCEPSAATPSYHGKSEMIPPGGEPNSSRSWLNGFADEGGGGGIYGFANRSTMDYGFASVPRYVAASAHYHPAAVAAASNYAGRKSRQTYTRFQTMHLESSFAQNKYITRQRRLELAHGIGLSDKQVKIWFQNRRMKQKKEHKDQALTSSSSKQSSSTGSGSTTGSSSGHTHFSDSTNHTGSASSHQHQGTKCGSVMESAKGSVQQQLGVQLQGMALGAEAKLANGPTLSHQTHYHHATVPITPAAYGTYPTHHVMAYPAAPGFYPTPKYN